MDPLSQAVTGAALAGLAARKHSMRSALFIGACGGMAPDLDILIRSDVDPLIALEYHRHFTHSMAFAPVGGLLVAAFFWLLSPIRKSFDFSTIYLFAFLGYFTHGFLDSCTGYGTHLLWPFSDARESWNVIGIIDPFYTLPAFAFLLIAWIWRSWDNVMAASLLMVSYLMLGVWQQHRATDISEAWLASEQVEYNKLTLRPTIGNLWLWRMLYHDKATNRWQTHALYIPYWKKEIGIKHGESAAMLSDEVVEDYPEDTIAGNDLRRFEFFSAGYLSRHDRPDGSFYIGDARYGMTPDSAQPLWGIEMPATHDQHVYRHRNLRKEVNWSRVEDMLRGAGFKPID